MKTIIIAIAGGSGSGKTTLANRLRDQFSPADTLLISHDSYYKPHSDLTYAQRTQLNYDHPDAFDTDLLIQHLTDLKNGIAVDRPVYDFAIHDRTEETVHCEPAPVIIVEGFLLFVEPRLTDLFDFRIFVDTDADVRILRRILRDVNERGRTLDSVISQYLNTVKPMHEAFVEPSKRKADLIVPEGGKNAAALDVLVRYVETHLHNNPL